MTNPHLTQIPATEPQSDDATFVTITESGFTGDGDDLVKQGQPRVTYAAGASRPSFGDLGHGAKAGAAGLVPGSL
jgi:hypothetical protein